MPLGTCDQTTTEQEFATHVQCVTAAEATEARAELTALLRESHPVYRERSAAAVVRMRGWVLLTLERVGVTDDELVYVLEELDNGHDPYLMAAAARALRTYPTPQPSFLPIVRRALDTIRYGDDEFTLQQYSGYAQSAQATTATRELRATQRWLKACTPARHSCCESASTAGSNADSGARERARPRHVPVQGAFEDQHRARVEFSEFFRGKPSVVVFFYTRCDNPQKCSLTVTKLGRLQQLMRDRGLAHRIRTAAITYDPAFDLPHRLRTYAQDRGVQFEANHRVLRATEHWDTLCNYFDLGVNFVGSIVNRHRIELFVLDADGRIAASFERLQWDEEEVLAQAMKLLPGPGDRGGDADRPSTGTSGVGGSVSSATVSTLASLAAAFFPKCAMCWTAYLSVFGIAGLERIPYAPWLLPLFIALMIVNLASLWPGQRGNVLAFALAVAGAQVILVLGIGCEIPIAAPVGLALSTAGSFLAVKSRLAQRRELARQLAFAPAGAADPHR